MKDVIKYCPLTKLLMMDHLVNTLYHHYEKSVRKIKHKEKLKKNTEMWTRIRSDDKVRWDSSPKPRDLSNSDEKTTTSGIWARDRQSTACN